MAGIAILSVALFTATGVAALSVDAILLAQVIASRALIEVPATDTIGIQNESSWAGTDEASLRVLTVVLAGLRRQLAFVDICNREFNNLIFGTKA